MVQCNYVIWWVNTSRLQLETALAGKTITIRIAGDCSGADALGHAWRSILRCLEYYKICRLNVVEGFGSEHPEAIHCHNFLRQDCQLECLFKDMVGSIGIVISGSGSDHLNFSHSVVVWCCCELFAVGLHVFRWPPLVFYDSIILFVCAACILFPWTTCSCRRNAATAAIITHYFAP